MYKNNTIDFLPWALVAIALVTIFLLVDMQESAEKTIVAQLISKEDLIGRRKSVIFNRCERLEDRAYYISNLADKRFISSEVEKETWGRVSKICQERNS